jgi:transposase
MIRIQAIWLAAGASDLRCGIDSLLARVVHGVPGGAQAHHAYVFANRSASRIKLLVYDGAGVWLCTRRLQTGRFVWPAALASQGSDPRALPTVSISTAQWDWLVAGAPWQHAAPPAAITVV